MFAPSLLLHLRFNHLSPHHNDMSSSNQIKPLIASHYSERVAAGALQADEGQRKVIARLAILQESLIQDAEHKPFLLTRIIGHKPMLEHYGAYIWGDVGRGKTLVMDLLVETTPHPWVKRIHFHAFMRDIHARMHAWRQLKQDEDLLPRVVREIAADTRLLCLDELQVHDVTDAMILSRLFTLLFEEGVAVIFTSNRPPNELYRSGLQREQFMKFVTLIEQRLDILELRSPHDYRLQQLAAMERVYLHPLNDHSLECLFNIYTQLTAGKPSVKILIKVQGRTLMIEKSCAGIAWLTFAELCERPLGSGDYLELARVFHTVIVQDIPQMNPDKRNEAKRFVNLIDTLYDQKVKLICSAAVPPEQLYPQGDGAFEFERTVSRLIDMQSQSYLGASHLSEDKL